MSEKLSPESSVANEDVDKNVEENKTSVKLSPESSVANEDVDKNVEEIENPVKQESSENIDNGEKIKAETTDTDTQENLEKTDDVNDEQKTVEKKEENSKENSETKLPSPNKKEKKTKNKEMVLQKLKILALHGYRQNGEVFRQKSGSFRKLLHKYAQFTYVTAPHKVTVIKNEDSPNDVDVGQDPDSTEQYGWWFNRDDLTFRGARKGGPAIGFEKSIQLIEDTFKEHGPFDGVLGFSQGACLVGLLCDLQARGLTTVKFDFAIMASGFKSGSLPHMKYYNESIDLPTMHIYGDGDEIIPKEMSIALREVFECGDTPPITVIHPGGHFLPGNSAQKSVYQNFMKLRHLNKMHAEKLDNSINL